MNDKHPLTPFAGILYSKWVADSSDATIIIGRWTEDDSPYKIKVPYQLRESIIAMQNWLADKVMHWDDLQRQILDIKRFFK